MEKTDKAGAPVIGDDGKRVLEAPIDRPGYLWFYLAGLIFISVAAALYVGPQGRVIIEFEVPAASNGSKPKVISVARDVGGTNNVGLDKHVRGNVVLCMMTKAEVPHE